LTADYCLYITEKDAQEGSPTFTLKDATHAISSEGFEKVKLDIQDRGGKIIHSSEVF